MDYEDFKKSEMPENTNSGNGQVEKKKKQLLLVGSICVVAVILFIAIVSGSFEKKTEGEPSYIVTTPTPQKSMLTEENSSKKNVNNFSFCVPLAWVEKHEEGELFWYYYESKDNFLVVHHTEYNFGYSTSISEIEVNQFINGMYKYIRDVKKSPMTTKRGVEGYIIDAIYTLDGVDFSASIFVFTHEGYMNAISFLSEMQRKEELNILFGEIVQSVETHELPKIIPSSNPAEVQATSTPTPVPEPVNSLGFTANEFMHLFNRNASELDSNLTAYYGKALTGIIDMNTTSDSVTLSTYIEDGYVTTVIVKGTGTGSTASGIEQMYAMVAAARAVDSKLTTSEASNFILELLESAPRGGANYSKTKNGFKYTVSAMTGSTWLQISK